MNKSLYEIYREARVPIESDVSAMREAILKHCRSVAELGYESVILNYGVICEIYPFTKPDTSRWFNTVSDALRLIHIEDGLTVYAPGSQGYRLPWVAKGKIKGQYPQVGSTPYGHVSNDPEQAMLNFEAKVSWKFPKKESE